MTDNEPLDQPESSKEPNDPRIVTVIIPLLSVAFLGVICKVMLWPGFAILVLTSTGALSAYMVAQVAFGRKSLFNLILLLANIFLLMFFLWGNFFNDGHPFNEKGLMVYGSIFMILFAILLFNRWLKTRSKKN